MNHDITHCIGEDRTKNPYQPCPRRDTCHRYLASQDPCLPAVALIIPWVLPMDCINNDYNLYWEDKE